MIINLRRAAALQNSIHDALRGIALTTTVRLNEFQEPEAIIGEQHAQLVQNLTRRKNLISSLYEIRERVGDANQSKGINRRLTEIARLDREIQDLQNLANSAVRLDNKVIDGQINKIRGDTSPSERRLYGFDATVETSVLKREDIDEYRRRMQELKRAQQRLKDEVLEINVESGISLTLNTQQTLQAENLM